MKKILAPLFIGLSLFVFMFAPQPALAQSGSAGFCIGDVCFGGSWGDGNVFGGAGCSQTICRIGLTFIFVINNILVPVLFAVSFMVFLFGVANAYIFSQGDGDKVSKGHRLILYGLIGFAIMVSIWGLVNIVANTFGLQGSYAPPLPTSY